MNKKTTTITMVIVALVTLAIVATVIIFAVKNSRQPENPVEPSTDITSSTEKPDDPDPVIPPIDSDSGTETDKAESTGNSNACAELSVNKGDNRLNYHRQKHKGNRKALGGTISVSTANGDENAQCKRNKQANNKPACGQGACGGENTVDNVVKHSEKSFRLWMKTLGTERYRIVQPQCAAPRF